MSAVCLPLVAVSLGLLNAVDKRLHDILDGAGWHWAVVVALQFQRQRERCTALLASVVDHFATSLTAHSAVSADRDFG